MFLWLLPLKPAAAESSKRYAAGAPLSIFDGVPVAFKDMIAIRGYVMTDGSAFKRRFNAVASDDDLLVRRFREVSGFASVPVEVDWPHPSNPHTPVVNLTVAYLLLPCAFDVPCACA